MRGEIRSAENLDAIPAEEIDEPFESDERPDLEIMQLEAEEREKERNEGRYMNATALFFLCMVLLFLIYLVDVVTSWRFNHSGPRSTETMIEVAKALLFLIGGYLFGRSAG